MNFKDKLNQGFKNARKAGYVARQDFSCCTSCGSYECSTFMAAHPEKYKGYVFFHRQDTGHLNELAKRGKTLGVHLAWSGDGQEIAQAMKDAGLNVEWDGTESKKIFVWTWDAYGWEREMKMINKYDFPAVELPEVVDETGRRYGN